MSVTSTDRAAKRDAVSSRSNDEPPFCDEDATIAQQFCVRHVAIVREPGIACDRRSIRVKHLATIL